MASPASASSVSSACLISFCGRISIIGGRSRPFQPRKDAFLRLKGDALTIHRDEENSQLIMPAFSIGQSLMMVKRKDDVFKMYFHDGAETILRLRMDINIAAAFAFLLQESWKASRDREGGGGVRRGFDEDDGEWTMMARGWTRRRRKCSEPGVKLRGGEWRESLMVLSEQQLVIITSDPRKKEKEQQEERIDLRKVISCQSHFDRTDWCEGVKEEKEKEERQSACSISIACTDGQELHMDSREMKLIGSLRSLISASIAIPQTSLSTCRLSERDVPVVVEEAIKFLSEERRLCTRGIYRISAKSAVKNRLVECMIHSPLTVFSSLDSLRADANGGIALQVDYAKDEVYMVCDGLRSFLRRMASPLIPDLLHIPLFDAMVESSLSTRLDKVHSVLHSRHFPLVHRATLSLLISHLREVAERSEHNGMNEENLARILAPSLFSSENSWEVLDEITPRVNSTLFIIENFPLLEIESYREFRKQKKLREEQALLSSPPPAVENPDDL